MHNTNMLYRAIDILIQWTTDHLSIPPELPKRPVLDIYSDAQPY